MIVLSEQALDRLGYTEKVFDCRHLLTERQQIRATSKMLITKGTNLR
jgi:hypothetical protein